MSSTTMEPRVLDETLIDLEFALDEVKGCEIQTSFHEKRFAPCSTEVTHLLRKTCQGQTRLSCNNYAEAIAREIRECLDKNCPDCNRPIQDCWELIPA